MDYKLIGVPCGHHGPYTFYKAFKYTKNDKTNILALSEFFFVKLWNDSDLVSIGELQLLWEDKNTEQTLASLRLYILPENTPEGRNDFHGEDEVLAITEKVVIRLEDLLTWITDATDWNWGLSAVWNEDSNGKKFTPPLRPQLLNDCTAIDLEDIDKEKDLLDDSHWETSTGVVVLSFPRYCRYRGILKRLEGVHNKWLRTALVVALGGFTVPCRNTRVLFCKDTFDYPDLEGHELLCNHLAPKLKGRPRRKRKRLNSRTPSPEESEDSESESSVKSSNSSSSSNTTCNNNNNNKARISLPLNRNRNGLQVTLSPRRSTRAAGVTLQEKEFLSKLNSFMKNRLTPINRVPTIGYKEIDLFMFYNKVKHLGGYDSVTASKLWKYVYEEMGGDQNSTSAATIARRHYEKLLLPYERHLGGGQNILAVKNKQITEVALSTTPATTTATTTIITTGSSSTTNTIPSVTISPSVTATLINVPHQQDKDKKIGLSSKPGSLRGVRLKQDKSNNLNLIEVKSGGKENIPVTNTTKTTTATPPVKQQPSILTEFIDLVSDDSQSPSKANANVTVPPSLKKQKLEILKEGGLEVTPVTTASATNGTVSDQISSTSNNISSSDNSISNKDSAVQNDDSSDKNKSSPEPSDNTKKDNSNNQNDDSIIKDIVSSSVNTSTSSSLSSKSSNSVNSTSNSVNNKSSNVSNNAGNIITVPQPPKNTQHQQNRTNKTDEARPSVIKHTYPDSNGKNNKISITVTPDVTSMLTMSGLSSTRLPSTNSVSLSTQQHRPSQPLPGLWPGRTVYGNPKDGFQQSIKRPVAEEVLDLRTKTDKNNSAQHQQPPPKQNNSSINVTKQYGQIGSNLEITLVPANKYNNNPSVSMPSPNHAMLAQQQQQHQQIRRRKSQINNLPIFANGSNLSNASLRNLNIASSQLANASKQQPGSTLVVPSVSLTVNQKKQLQQMPHQFNNHHHNNNHQKKVMSHQISSTTLPHSQQSRHNNTPNSSRLPSAQTNPYHHLNSFQNHHKIPFIPAAMSLDPIYFSALFNGLVPPTSNSASPSPSHRHSSNSVYNNYPTPEQLQSYRELLRRHSLPHTMLPDGFPRLLNDGSTSITLVSSHSTPTSK